MKTHQLNLMAIRSCSTAEGLPTPGQAEQIVREVFKPRRCDGIHGKRLRKDEWIVVHEGVSVLA